MDSIGDGGAPLGAAAVHDFIERALAGADLAGRSVCVVVPDGTRTCPLPTLPSAVRHALAGRVSRLTVLVALGTHQPMTGGALDRHLGPLPEAAVLNHEWWDPAAFSQVGEIGADEVAGISGGLLAEPVTVRVNRHLLDHDVALVVGPVFPHEVVGFSGGNKYFFPGVSGPEVIDLTHWLGALITSSAIIGRPGRTPVRALIDRAAAMIPVRRRCLAVTVAPGTDRVSFAAFGTPERAWAAAAEVSARVHVRWLAEPVRRVLSLVPPRYADIWTAAKGMYKVEPVVADGGEVIVHAPHISEVSRTHGAEIAKVGYHCRDYLLAHREELGGIPRSVLAHSSHLRGTGTVDTEGAEHCRITVTLATGIDRQDFPR